MGSRSDWETMRHAAETLDELGVPYEERGRLRAPHARPALRVRRVGRGARPAGDDRRRRRRRAPARAWRRRRRRCPCSACRSSRRPCRASTRCSRSCRCRPACRSGRSRSAAPEPSTRRCSRPRSSRAADEARRASGSAAYRGEQTESVLGQPDPAGVTRDSSAVIGGGQLGRMLALAGRPLGVALPLPRPVARRVRRARSAS